MDANSPNEADKAIISPPKGVWGSILTTTPIALTVLATAFAGLSSSEMTQSMYYRSLAAQHQSKAGDQWGFFQAKRIRGTSLDMTSQLLQTLARPDMFEPSQIETTLTQILDKVRKQPATGSVAKIEKVRDKLTALLANETTRQNLSYLTGTSLPKVEERRPEQNAAQDAIDAVVDAIRHRQTEGETKELVAKINPDQVEKAVRLAEQDADDFDNACKPINETIKQFNTLLVELAAEVKPVREPGLDHSVEALNNSFKAAALEFDARRYEREAAFNKKVAEIYEVQVRRSSLASDRHRDRSKKFFYCMLLAQAGVTISSLALAGAKRSWLWLLAALAGVTSLAFSTYVYLLS